MSKLYQLSLFILLLGLAACSKDQDMVDYLDGEWRLINSEAYVDGQLDSTLSSTDNLLFQFDGCTLSEGELCTGREIQQTSTGAVITNFNYSVIEAGTQITFDYNEQTLVDNFAGYIQENSNNRLVFEFYFGTAPSVIQFIYTLERQ